MQYNASQKNHLKMIVDRVSNLLDVTGVLHDESNDIAYAVQKMQDVVDEVQGTTELERTSKTPTTPDKTLIPADEKVCDGPMSADAKRAQGAESPASPKMKELYSKISDLEVRSSPLQTPVVQQPEGCREGDSGYHDSSPPPGNTTNWTDAGDHQHASTSAHGNIRAFPNPMEREAFNFLRTLIPQDFSLSMIGPIKEGDRAQAFRILCEYTGEGAAIRYLLRPYHHSCPTFLWWLRAIDNGVRCEVPKQQYILHELSRLEELEDQSGLPDNADDDESVHTTEHQDPAYDDEEVVQTAKIMELLRTMPRNDVESTPDPQHPPSGPSSRTVSARHTPLSSRDQVVDDWLRAHGRQTLREKLASGCNTKSYKMFRSTSRKKCEAAMSAVNQGQAANAAVKEWVNLHF